MPPDVGSAVVGSGEGLGVGAFDGGEVGLLVGGSVGEAVLGLGDG